MAINIKEILHPGDSDSVKFEKINYNFDQILINGGGPQGPQGQKGEQGQQGATGTKGQKGEQGDQGVKGDTGVSDTPWSGVEHSNGVSAILKPKKSLDLDLDGTPTTYSKMPAIWLGDTGFEEGVSDGDNSTTARLTLGLEPGVFDEYIKLWHSSNQRLNLMSVDDNTYAEFRFQKSLGDGDVALKLNVDRITLTADNDELLLQGQNVTIQGLGNNNVKIEALGTGNLTVDAPSIFLDNASFNSNDFIKIPAGTDAQRPGTALAGMIRFNTDSEVYEGYTGTAWKQIGGLTDMDGDTYITPEETADEDILKFYVGGTTSTLVAKMGDDATDGVNTLVDVNEFVQPVVVDDNIYVDSEDKGLVFKARTATSGVQPANYNSATQYRTIHDYFYRTSVAVDPSFATVSDTSPFDSYSLYDGNITKTIGSTDKLSTDIFYIHRKFSSNSSGTLQVAKMPVAVIMNSTTSRISYVKIGHNVNVWGRLQFFPHPVNPGSMGVPETGNLVNFHGDSYTGSAVSNAPSARVMIFPAAGSIWPYKNAAPERVIFPIHINLEGLDWTSTSTLNNDDKYYGIIFPGQLGFNIVRVAPGSINAEAYESASATPSWQPNETTGTYADMYADYMTLADFEALSKNSAEVTLEFNFSMVTNVNSYDAINATDVRAMYSEGTDATQILGGGGGGSFLVNG